MSGPTAFVSLVRDQAEFQLVLSLQREVHGKSEYNLRQNIHLIKFYFREFLHEVQSRN